MVDDGRVLVKVSGDYYKYYYKLTEGKVLLNLSSLAVSLTNGIVALLLI